MPRCATAAQRAKGSGDRGQEPEAEVEVLHLQTQVSTLPHPDAEGGLLAEGLHSEAQASRQGAHLMRFEATADFASQ